jgi:hypothetical protein
MVLRLTVPAGGIFPEVAAALAVKVAEHLGHGEADARSTGAAVQSLVSRVAPPAPSDSAVTLEFHQTTGELRIEARCDGRSSEARHPLPT